MSTCIGIMPNTSVAQITQYQPIQPYYNGWPLYYTYTAPPVVIYQAPPVELAPAPIYVMPAPRYVVTPPAVVMQPVRPTIVQPVAPTPMPYQNCIATGGTRAYDPITGRYGFYPNCTLANGNVVISGGFIPD